MADASKSRERVELRDKLFQAGMRALMDQGWGVSRASGMGKASVRRIEKGDQSLLVSIRTSQDKYIAFPPKPNNTGWVTLDDVDVVIAVSVDDTEAPKEALVHWLPGDEMRERFTRALKARTAAGHVKPEGRGIFLPLYHIDESNWRFVGGGFGMVHKPIAQIPLSNVPPSREPPSAPAGASAGGEDGGGSGGGSVIAEAKRMISRRIGVPESAIRITIEA